MSKNLARVRVEVNPKDDPDIAGRKLIAAFHSACLDAGIKQTCKQYEAYESKSRKKRRKKRESDLARLKIKLRENFLQRGKK